MSSSIPKVTSLCEEAWLIMQVFHYEKKKASFNIDFSLDSLNFHALQEFGGSFE